ncbi:MAG: histidinol-phosphatase HisJ family protein [Lachnospiraceae bacterium]|nr:histidinol-phosphatase HisJ family protein [Lachnospiraceae bacterium]
MPILADCHMHSHHSGDSDASMESMIEAAIGAGLDTIAFTEHQDFCYATSPEGAKDKVTPTSFMLNADSYLYELLNMREKYRDKIRIEFGLEIGLQENCVKDNLIFARAHEYDYIIGSQHLVGGQDPYYESFYEGKDEKEVFRQYLTETLTNIKKFNNFDCLGHMDYIVRYFPSGNREYSYSEYGDIIDEILKHLIENEKGIEINTKSISKGMKEFHPCMAVLKRYRELGGEIVTVGSDAHKPQYVGSEFARVPDVMLEAGFKYYCVYENRLPEYHKL